MTSPAPQPKHLSGNSWRFGPTVAAIVIATMLGGVPLLIAEPPPPGGATEQPASTEASVGWLPPDSNLGTESLPSLVHPTSVETIGGEEAIRLDPGWSRIAIGIVIGLVIASTWHAGTSYQRRRIMFDLIDRVPLICILVDQKGLVRCWNPTATRLIGPKEGETLGRPIRSLPPFDRALPGQDLTPDLPATSFDLEHSMSAGSTRRLHFDTGILPRYHFMMPAMLMLIGTDVTIQHQHAELFQSLQSAQEQMQRLSDIDHMKSEFLAVCSHELKTPLVSITGYLELIASGRMGPLTDRQTSALAVSLKNAQRLNQLLSSLVDFARMDMGALRFEFTTHRLHHLIEEVILVIEPLARAKSVMLAVDLPADLPRVVADTTLIHRALTNLLDNAVKFTGPQGVITVRARIDPSDHPSAAGRAVIIEVEDTGIGIDPAKVGKVKDPFYQVDASDTRRTGGMGLGLAIVEKILRGHQTTLTIDSVPGRGTKASFRLQVSSQSKSGRIEQSIEAITQPAPPPTT